jgi:hypothetical protein
MPPLNVCLRYGGRQNPSNPPSRPVPPPGAGLASASLADPSTTAMRAECLKTIPFRDTSARRPLLARTRYDNLLARGREVAPLRARPNASRSRPLLFCDTRSLRRRPSYLWHVFPAASQGGCSCVPATEFGKYMQEAWRVGAGALENRYM